MMFRHAAGCVLVMGLAACAAGVSAGSSGSAPAGPTSQPAPGAPPSGGAAASSGPSGGGSVLDGVYSARQASRGEDVFQAICSQCHGQNEFSGARFRVRWSGETVGDIYELVSTMMPEGDPGSLDPQEYIDVVAYLLRLNAYPAGEVDLPADRGALGTLRIEPASN